VEVPRLQTLYEKYKDQGFEIVAVEAMRDTERAKKFIEKNGITFTTIENPAGDAELVQTIFKVSGYPTSFLINRDGKVMFFHNGYEEGDEKKIEKEILRLL
jgi:cytochrome c biogenesis protein CcmG/thiol:disulfide interchange protein DsbE